MQGGELAHHTLVGVLLVGMHCLSMLAQIVEARELLSTMAGERTFAGVLPVERMMSESGTEEGGKGKEHGPNVPGQVFAPAKNHATIAITTTLERFCRRGTITPIDARGVLEVRLGVREDEGCGHVSVGGVRGRGVHYRGRDGGERGQERNPTDISIFRALSFSYLFFITSQPLGLPPIFPCSYPH